MGWGLGKDGMRLSWIGFLEGWVRSGWVGSDKVRLGQGLSESVIVFECVVFPAPPLLRQMGGGRW